jgi:hypothetical protein
VAEFQQRLQPCASGCGCRLLQRFPRLRQAPELAKQLAGIEAGPGVCRRCGLNVLEALKRLGVITTLPRQMPEFHHRLERVGLAAAACSSASCASARRPQRRSDWPI